MTNELNASPEVVSALTMIEPGTMIAQLGRFGMNHPPAVSPFEYTRAVLKSLLWDDAEIDSYVVAAQALGATDDKSLALNVLHPLSKALREATHKTLNELASRK